MMGGAQRFTSWLCYYLSSIVFQEAYKRSIGSTNSACSTSVLVRMCDSHADVDSAGIIAHFLWKDRSTRECRIQCSSLGSFHSFLLLEK